MSRANDITLLLLLLQASIGFVDATGLFTDNYMQVPVNNASYSITDLEDYSEQTNVNPNIAETALLYADFAWDAFLIGIKIIFAVVFILPTLVTVFGVPAILATFIQAGVYYIYATWYSQYKSKVGWKQIE